MLEQNDLQKIGEVVEQKMAKTVGEAVKVEFQAAEQRLEERIAKNVVDQVIDALDQNIMPAMDSILETAGRIEKKVNDIPDTVGEIIAKKVGQSIARDRTLMERTSAIVDALDRKRVLTSPEVAVIRQIQFASENQ